MAQRVPGRDAERGSAHIDMLFNMFLIISIFYVIVSTIQLTLADVSARNGNRMALQTFQVVYDRRTFPAELQTTGGARNDPNTAYAVAEARRAAALTGGTVFASGIVGGQGGLQGLEGYNYQGAYFNKGAYTGCSASQQIGSSTFIESNLVRTTATSEYPWRLGPFAICLRNTGQIVGRSN